jgi:hypothetical protein
LTPKFNNLITYELSSKFNQNNESSNNKRKREDYTNGESDIVNQKKKREDYHTTERSSISCQKEKCDTAHEECISAFKKGRFDNKPLLKTRKEASKALKKLLEGLDQECKGDVKDVYYIIENRDKVGVPLVSLKVIIRLY